MSSPDPSRCVVGSSADGRATVWPASFGTLLRLWPWVGSVGVAVVVDLVIGALRHFDFAGIEGFSTTNYGWLAFGLVGGLVMSWRLAESPAAWWMLVRWLVAPALSFIVCFVAVTIMGLVFLPGQPVAETLTTDAPGRSVWVAVVVAIGSGVCEVVRAVLRAISRYRAPAGRAM